MSTSNTVYQFSKKDIFEIFYTINKKGGPETFEYDLINNCINSIPLLLRRGVININDIETIKNKCEFLKTAVSVMGHIKMKPLGYPGDYLIIERIYQKTVSEKYYKWDQYSITNPAAEAVRNRKQFFKNLVQAKLQQQKTIQLLNIASGPARDLKEIYDEIDPKRLQTTCVEIDQRAIDHAKKLCGNYQERIEFINRNIFKLQIDHKFDIIWSAGLFDYFNDKTFTVLLKRLRENLNEHGEICIGNFSKDNPGRMYMEYFGEWFLHHRNTDDLHRLAVTAGGEETNIKIDLEPLAVNLFLRIKK